MYDLYKVSTHLHIVLGINNIYLYSDLKKNFN